MIHCRHPCRWVLFWLFNWSAGMPWSTTLQIDGSIRHMFTSVQQRAVRNWTTSCPRESSQRIEFWHFRWSADSHHRLLLCRLVEVFSHGGSNNSDTKTEQAVRRAPGRHPRPESSPGASAQPLRQCSGQRNHICVMRHQVEQHKVTGIARMVLCCGNLAPGHPLQVARSQHKANIALEKN
jgi:hypothetical protein